MKDRNLVSSDDWATPKYFYDPLNEEFHFDFDPCPLRSTFDGLLIDWGECKLHKSTIQQKNEGGFRVESNRGDEERKNLCMSSTSIDINQVVSQSHQA
jgi:hypothetical protein